MRFFSILVSALILVAAAFPQYHPKALERARTIKMLKDDRESVRKAFHDFVIDNSDETSDKFSFGETEVGVTYSSGKCDEGSEEMWAAPEGLVTNIEISFDTNPPAREFDQHLSGLMKEQVLINDEDYFVFHDKTLGIAFFVDGEQLTRIIVVPSIKGKLKTCRNDIAREFVSEKSWFGKSKLKDRMRIECPTADVTALALSHDKVSGTTSNKVQIETTAIDPENDPLKYIYIVSAGRIIGSGPKVVWDLTGIPAGTYKITAGVDDGCGLCGMTVTQTIVIE